MNGSNVEILTAFTVLQDPSVAASPVDKRIAFLQSKNLTQEEIDISLARAEDGSAQQSTPAPASQNQLGHANSQQQMMRQPVGYGYGPYQGAPWGHPPPESVLGQHEIFGTSLLTFQGLLLAIGEIGS